MNAKLVFLQTLLPLLSRLAQSPDKRLAAEAAEEHAVKSRELAKLKREDAKTSPEGATAHAA